jgi:hypothetical protein
MLSRVTTCGQAQQRLSAADAFSADQPVYIAMEPALRRACGAAVYDELAVYYQARQNGQPDAALNDPLALAVLVLDQRNTGAAAVAVLELGPPVAAHEALTGTCRLGLAPGQRLGSLPHLGALHPCSRLGALNPVDSLQ